ncbi:MAG: hypothetical protein F6K64_34570 [Moorea sp. SIO3A2]|nr:hypothetical protein [Moorena sp. SIO3A2]
MQRGLGGFPHERLHQDREFGVTPAISLAFRPRCANGLKPDSTVSS